MKQKILFLLLLLLSGAATGFARNTNGTCGKNLTWTFSEETLTISFQGDMKDYDKDSGNYPIWYFHKDDINAVVIEFGTIAAYK
jgi:hypothetical protein